jgi:hypothetical protein
MLKIEAGADGVKNTISRVGRMVAACSAGAMRLRLRLGEVARAAC